MHGHVACFKLCSMGFIALGFGLDMQFVHLFVVEFESYSVAIVFDQAKNPDMIMALTLGFCRSLFLFMMTYLIHFNRIKHFHCPLQVGMEIFPSISSIITTQNYSYFLLGGVSLPSYQRFQFPSMGKLQWIVVGVLCGPSNRSFFQHFSD